MPEIVDNAVLAALIRSSLPEFLPNISKSSNQGPPARVIRTGTSPMRASNSPTTLIMHAHLHAGMTCHHWGVPPTGFSQATCSHSGRVTSLVSPVGLRFRLPAHLTIEAVMQVDTGVMVSVILISASRAAEELTPAPFDPLPCAKREPLAFRSTAGAVLRRAPGIDLYSDR